MQMKTLEEKEVSKILKDYRIAKKIIELYEDGESAIVEKLTTTNLSKLYGDIALIDIIIDSLDDEIKEFIIKQYLTKKNDKWWLEFYSKSTYYRHKKNAVLSFLEQYNAQISNIYLH